MKQLKDLPNRVKTALRAFLDQVPRGRKLALELTVILFVLLAVWDSCQFSPLTRASAFRRALVDAAYPPAKLELQVERENMYVRGFWGVGIKDELACCALLYKTVLERDGEKVKFDRFWSASCIEAFPAVEPDVWCVPLKNWGSINLFSCIASVSFMEKCVKIRGVQDDTPCFAVKAPGETASLTLVLDDLEITEEDGGVTLSGGRFPLSLRERANGWFVFIVNFDQVKKEANEVKNEANELKYKYQYNNPYGTLAFWSYINLNTSERKDWRPEMVQSGHLELATFDEAGAPVKSVTLDLESVMKPSH